MLARFFKPKWQHPSAAVRARAVAELADDAADILSDLARNDPDPAVRRASIERLVDLHLLELILATDQDPGVQQLAGQRLRDFIAGTLGPLDTAERLAALERHRDHELIEHVARHGCDPASRCAAVVRVTRVPLLLEIIESDGAVDVRLAALGALQTEDDLDKACKLARKRDKRVYRSARDRLHALQHKRQAVVERQQQFATLCTRAEALLKCANMDGTRAALTQLEKAWQGLAEAGQPTEQTARRFADAVSAVNQMERAQRDRAARRSEGPGKLCADIESLLTSLADCPADQTDLDRVAERIDTFAQGWSKAQQEADEDEKARYHQLHARLRKLYQGERDAAQTRRKAAELLAKAEAAASSDKPVDSRRLASLQQAWPGTGQSADGDAGIPNRRFAAAIETLEKRLRAQREQASAQSDRAGELLDALEQALDAGESAAATRLQQQLQGIDKALQASGLHLPAAVRQRLQRQQSRLRELFDWQRFSNTAEREKLCEQVEALIGVELPAPEVATRIRAARNTWNALGRTDAEAIGTLRGRFNQACERAFEPCAAYNREQAEQRGANLVERRALVDGLQQTIDETDWGQVDIRRLDQRLREARDAWKAIGPVDHKAYKGVAKQFHQALDTLNGHLKKAREANLLRKEGLVKRAEALTGDDADLGPAMDGIRDLQRQWKAIGPAPRRQEQALWQRLQKAGDAVFSRRSAERDLARQAEQRRSAAYQALCDRLQALLEASLAPPPAEPPPLATIRQALEEVDQAWADGGELPNKLRAPLERRYAQLVGGLTQAMDERQRAVLAAQRQLAADAARLVAELEAAGDDDARAQIAERWRVLTAESDFPARHYLPSSLWQLRWQRAVEWRPGQPADPVTAERLCLQMEVAAAADSPAEAADQRMALQVERLSQSLQGSESGQGSVAELQALEADWWRLGPIGPAAPALTRRFLAARDHGYRTLDRGSA